MNKSRTTYSLINIFSNFIGYGINIILSFVCRMVFVRCLPQEYLGINGLFTNVLSMLALTELGIGTAIVYALYKPIAENNEKQIAGLMKFYGQCYKIIGITVATLGILLIPFLDFIIGEAPSVSENILVIYLLFLFNSASSYFFSYKSTILTASQRNYVVTSISYVFVVFKSIIQICVLLITHNYIVYLLIQIGSILLTNICISKKADKDYPYITNKNIEPLSSLEKKQLFGNVKALTVYKFSGILVNNIDSIVITYFKGLVTTGAASNYTLFTNMISTMLNMVFSGMTAGIGNVNAVESQQTKFKIFKSINLASFWLYGLGTLGIALVAEDMVELFFGSKFLLSKYIPIILAINFFVMGMQSTVLCYKTTMGLFKQGQYILLITALINVLGNIILGKFWGLEGIFISTIIARLFTNAWYDPYAVYKYGLRRKPIEYFKVYCKYVTIIVSVFFICNFLKMKLVLPLILKIVVEIVLCIVIWNSCIVLIYRKTEEFIYIKDKINSLANIGKQKVLRFLER